MFDQRVKTRRQKCRAYAIEPRREIAKPHRAEQKLSDDEQRPALSNDLSGPRQRAELVITCSTHSGDTAVTFPHHFISMTSATSMVP
jgi:hypothetical protein